MTARRTATGLAMLLGATIAVAACGSAAPTTAPSTAVTPAPTTAPPPTFALPSLGLPGSFALPSFTSDTELEAMFPTEIGGKPLTVRSMSGADFMAFGGSGMSPALDKLGKSPADMSVAFGGTADASIVVIAFRIQGTQADQFLSAYIATAQQAQGATITDASFSGKAAKKVVTPAQTVYIYLHGDVTWTVGGPALTDATLNEIFSKLP
jgi:hypothetical protein